MTEVTRVPLQPIAKGSLTKLWLGVIIAALIGAGIAFAAVPKGVSFETLTEGSGPNPTQGDMVFVNYVGKLADGTVFQDSSEVQMPFPEGLLPKGVPMLVEEGASIEGFYEALQKVQKGGKYLIEIPSEKGYGSTPPPGSPIPADADLVFEIEVLDYMPRADFEMRLQAMQQMMQQQGAEGGPGGPAGAPAGGPAGAPAGQPAN